MFVGIVFFIYNFIQKRCNKRTSQMVELFWTREWDQGFTGTSQTTGWHLLDPSLYFEDNSVVFPFKKESKTTLFIQLNTTFAQARLTTNFLDGIQCITPSMKIALSYHWVTPLSLITQIPTITLNIFLKLINLFNYFRALGFFFFFGRQEISRFLTYLIVGIWVIIKVIRSNLVGFDHMKFF